MTKRIAIGIDHPPGSLAEKGITIRESRAGKGGIGVNEN
jgi:hypothetical protein